MDYKIIISSVAVILTFVGYVPYIRDVLNKKTKPHMFTWLVWTIAGAIACGLQIAGGAGVGVWALLAACCICFVVFILSLRVGDKDITFSDVIFLVLAIAALLLWLVAKQPVWSVILATLTELLGFAPTVRKSWNKPYSETLSLYTLSFVRHGLAFFAVQKFNILTVFYPVAWTIANLLFSVYLIVRRKQVKQDLGN